jgi:uncharacterized protein (TIGR02996 family)
MTPSSEEIAFYRAIRSAFPADAEDARLVFADWLEDQGRAKDAAYVRNPAAVESLGFRSWTIQSTGGVVQIEASGKCSLVRLAALLGRPLSNVSISGTGLACLRFEHLICDRCELTDPRADATYTFRVLPQSETVNVFRILPTEGIFSP